MYEDHMTDRRGMALLTDLYQLTMAGGYFAKGIAERRACFEYFFRKLPPDNGYAITAGLDAVIDYLRNLKFSAQDLRYLKDVVGGFSDEFLEYLKRLKFTGDLWAIPEGTPVFPHEPILRIEAPLIQAQLVESFVLNAMNYATLVATKASRICWAAEGEPVLEFGLRRAQGPDGSLCGARAAYIGGCSATSNVMAGKLHGIPVKGTMAHSWVMSFDNELEAFRVYAETYPHNPVLLVDTYDTIESGVPNAIRVFEELREKNPNVRAAIRIDSGDLAKLSKEAHALLAEAGFENPVIIASSDLDENLIADIKRQGAKVNSWGVGTNLITSYDSPALGGVYKLVAIADGGNWKPRIKVSGNPVKVTTPYPKEVYRFYDSNLKMVGDAIYRFDEDCPARTSAAPYRVVGHDVVNLFQRTVIKDAVMGERLMQCYIEGGTLKFPLPYPATSQISEFSKHKCSKLPLELRRLRNPEIYKVCLSPELARCKQHGLMDGWVV